MFTSATVWLIDGDVKAHIAQFALASGAFYFLWERRGTYLFQDLIMAFPSNVRGDFISTNEGLFEVDGRLVLFFKRNLV